MEDFACLQGCVSFLGGEQPVLSKLGMITKVSRKLFHVTDFQVPRCHTTLPFARFPAGMSCSWPSLAVYLRVCLYGVSLVIIFGRYVSVLAFACRPGRYVVPDCSPIRLGLFRSSPPLYVAMSGGYVLE